MIHRIAEIADQAICVGLTFLAVALSTASSAKMPDAAREVPTITRSIECIELTERGLGDDAINKSLVELAVADAKRLGRSIRLYKVVAGPTGNYYLFHMGGWSDIYTVYETDPQGSQFVGKYQYSSLHYPCPAAGDPTQTREQETKPPIHS